MAHDPQIGYEIKATILGVKGDCDAGHKEGETFEISCFDPAGFAAGSTMIYSPACKPFSLGARCRGGRETAFNWDARIRKILSPFNYSGQSGLN